MKKFIPVMLLFLAVIMSVVASGCVSNKVTYTISSTTSTISTTTTTVISTIVSTFSSTFTKVVSTSSTITATSIFYKTVTITTTSTVATGVTDVMVSFVIITIPIDNDGKPNNVVYVPVSTQIVYLTGAPLFEVYYWKSLAGDEYVLPLFSYVDAKYYSMYGINSAVPLDAKSAVIYLDSIFLDSPTLPMNPASYVDHTNIPINVFYAFYGLNAIFRDATFEYFFIGSSEIGIRYDNFFIVSYSAYSGSNAFSAKYGGTVATVVSFYPGEPYATVYLTPLSTPSLFWSKFPRYTYAFECTETFLDKTIVYTGTKYYSTWFVTITSYSGTKTTSLTVSFVDYTLIVDTSLTKTMNYYDFYSTFLPIPLWSSKLFYLGEDSYIVTYSTEFVTVSGTTFYGAVSGTLFIFTKL